MNFNFRQIASKLTSRQWLAVGGATLVGIVFVYVLFSLASSPSYSTVAAGVSPAQAGKITSALSSSGIPYQLANNGTAVSVESSKEAQARVVLDEQGLLDGTAATSSLEDFEGKSSLGESDFQQQQQNTSALEEQLEQQIETMNGINSAQVALAIPDEADDLFSDTSTQTTGSVLLNDTGDLGTSAVKSIAALVAGAVPGLSVNKVTVTDQDGDLLWPNSSGTTGSTTNTQSAEQSYDSTEAAKAEAQLDATLGPGKALVEVSGVLDTNQQTIDSVTYGSKGTPLSSDTTNEKLTGSGAAADAAAGDTATEDAATYAGTDGDGTSKYTDTTANNTYGVSKTVSESVISPGAVNSQTISVLVNSSVPASEVPAIKSAVESAVGYKAGRDTIAVGRIPFAKVAPVAAAGAGMTKMLGYVKYLAIGMAALVFLLMTTRMLRRREGEAFAGTPTWLRELETPRPLAALEGGPSMFDLDSPAPVARLRSPVSPARQQVEDLVDRDPERVASQVRQWMTED